MLYPTVDGRNTTGVATVDCHKQVRSWRLLLSIAKLLIPTCNCIITQENNKELTTHMKPSYKPSPTATTGTLFGYRRGRVTLCIQTSPKSTSPILLLELSIPTNVLAREMKGGSIRFAFECKGQGRTYDMAGFVPKKNSGSALGKGSRDVKSGSLLSMPLWTMYCNGRKLGLAHVKKKGSIRAADMEILRRIETVVVGAGITRVDGQQQDVMYLRGKFERFHGSANSESFHLVDQDGNNGGQELSFYFLRSR